jgi:hypothetical protein
MNLCGLLGGLKNKTKVINLKILPSMGLFYNDDFWIKIKKATAEDISDYEFGFQKDDLGIIISKVKIIIEKNIILPNSYKFDDLKSIDIVFLFIEIVKWTIGKDISINYLDESTKKLDKINFSSENFNYFNLNEELSRKYDEINKVFNIDGYSFSLPSIGIENSLSYFLLTSKNSKKYSNLNFNFSYFLDKKDFLTNDEIENLIEIFNFDLDESEKQKIEGIIKKFKSLQKYSLIKDGKEIDINSKIDLENIWK